MMRQDAQLTRPVVIGSLIAGGAVLGHKFF